MILSRFSLNIFFRTSKRSAAKGDLRSLMSFANKAKSKKKSEIKIWVKIDKKL